jgi:hypothetical protein
MTGGRSRQAAEQNPQWRRDGTEHPLQNWMRIDGIVLTGHRSQYTLA